MRRNILLIALAILVGLISGYWQNAGRGVPEAAKTAASATQQQSAPAKAKHAYPTGVPIFMYHSVAEEKDNDAVISRELFARQMEFLHQKGFEPVTLGELCNYLQGKGDLPAKPVVLTFDDGYRDTYEIVMPILKKYGFKSTVFIPASFVGDRLSWAELKEMKAAGMEIASHSMTHRELGGMTAAAQTEEIIKSKEILDANLKQDTRYFCYPNGSYNQETLRILKDKGFIAAVTLQPGWVKPGDDLMVLRRVWIGNGVDLAHFEERLTKPDYSML